MKRVRKLLWVFLSDDTEEVHSEHVHFHRGPQGQAIPCYDRDCEIPRLSVD